MLDQYKKQSNEANRNMEAPKADHADTDLAKAKKEAASLRSELSVADQRGDYKQVDKLSKELHKKNQEIKDLEKRAQAQQKNVSKSHTR